MEVQPCVGGTVQGPDLMKESFPEQEIQTVMNFNVTCEK